MGGQFTSEEDVGDVGIEEGDGAGLGGGLVCERHDGEFVRW